VLGWPVDPLVALVIALALNLGISIIKLLAGHESFVLC
jgi:hypothetical protein